MNQIRTNLYEGNIYAHVHLWYKLDLCSFFKFLIDIIGSKIIIVNSFGHNNYVVKISFRDSPNLFGFGSLSSNE